MKKIIKWPLGRLDFSAGTLVMGILNVTPDSFSDGGRFLNTDTAVERALKMAKNGAAIIDIGPESTRPGAEPVSTEQQIARAVPVIEKLSGKIDIPISIDTYNHSVARAAINAGASIINDITALADDNMATLAAEKQVPVVLMHMQGTPQTMQAEPKYHDVLNEVITFLVERAKHAEKLGILKERIFIDPGIGFGKTFEHNITLLRNIDKFTATGYKVLIGTSRKSFIGTILDRKNSEDRIFGTAATVALSVIAGASIVRVHDVAQMVDVVKVASVIRENNKD